MRHSKSDIVVRLREAFLGPQALAFLPALCLAAYWFGGEQLLIVCALLVPAVLASFTGLTPYSRSREAPEQARRDGLTGLPLSESLISALDSSLSMDDPLGRKTACLVLEIDDFDALKTQFGDAASEDVIRICADRLKGALRDQDKVVRLGVERFGVAFAPMRHVDLEKMIQLASRLQAVLSEPVSIHATRVHLTASIGFCLPNRAPKPTGQAFLDAALLALTEAHHTGPGAMRSYTPARQPLTLGDGKQIGDLEGALEQGQIVPWFQPQLSTDTGEVSGMEALARWEHPDQGLIPPGQFMPLIEDLGLTERLSEVILFHALMAVKTWDKAGYKVPYVAVNFSPMDLANPKIVDKVCWELDRFELDPSRLSVEILENVIASSDDDMITRNIWALKDIGCRIELDDYGTGHASLANIRRFAVDRIKIDRSYVARCDLDRDQQTMLSAILTMAERLQLTTLAEGVETIGEHAMLAQLGCDHVQGFSISRPLPFGQTLEWMSAHKRKLSQTPRIGNQAS